jgi:lysophospholipase L1-like esterase
MLARILILLLFLNVNTGCSDPMTENHEDNNMETEDQADHSETRTYLALGDSYTIGQSVPEEDRFPVILADRLNELGHGYGPPKIVAKTGWTTDELAAALLQENIRDTFDLVTLLIGVNNQYRGRSLDNYRAEYRSLLDQAIAFAGGNPENVIVVSIPDWGVSPFAEGRDRDKIAKEIDAFNTVKKEETLQKNVKFVDITDISRTALGQSRYFAPDGLHFSGEMHALWVNEIVRLCF